MNICESAHICDDATNYYFPSIPESIIAKWELNSVSTVKSPLHVTS